MQKKQFFLGFFLLVSCVNVWAKVNAFDLLAAGSKTVIIPALIALVFLQGNPSKKYIIALFFSWLGDVLLIPQGTPFFYCRNCCVLGNSITVLLLDVSAITRNTSATIFEKQCTSALSLG